MNGTENYPDYADIKRLANIYLTTHGANGAIRYAETFHELATVFGVENVKAAIKDYYLGSSW